MKINDSSRTSEGGDGDSDRETENGRRYPHGTSILGKCETTGEGEGGGIDINSCSFCGGPSEEVLRLMQVGRINAWGNL